MSTAAPPRRPFDRDETQRQVRHPLQTLRKYIRAYVLLEGAAIAVLFLAAWFWGGLRLRDVRAAPMNPGVAATSARDPAAILFTSGSTGLAKGVLYDHGTFDAQVRALRESFRFGKVTTLKSLADEQPAFVLRSPLPFL